MKPKQATKEIAVESGIEMPPTRLALPFWDMKVGNSFLVPCEPAKAQATRSRVSGAAAYFKKRHATSTHFATRIVDGGVRCWRLK